MGSVNLDNTGSGSAITLSSDGTSLLLDGTAIGGGGAALELYAENPSTPTTPVATGANAVAIGSGTTASGSDSVGIGQGVTSYGAQSLALGASAYVLGQYATGVGRGVQALSASSTAIGRGSSVSAHATSGSGAMALGGSYASGTDSLAAAIANNTSSYGATGANSVAIGKRAKATDGTSTAIGQDAVASNGGFAFGVSSVASASGSVALGGPSVADKVGKLSFTGRSLSGTGQTQAGMIVLMSDTTDATPEALTSNNSTASTTNQVILPNNSAYAFHGTIVARQQAPGTACAAWKIEGLIRRENGVGTTVLVNSATTVLDNTPAWGMALTADTTNGGLKIEVTGAAATNIRWVATINTSEVTYA